MTKKMMYIAPFIKCVKWYFAPVASPFQSHFDIVGI